MFEEKREVAESSPESVDDITAAATAPIPMIETKGGARFSRTSGMMKVCSPRICGDGRPYCVWFQSEKEENVFHDWTSHPSTQTDVGVGFRGKVGVRPDSNPNPMGVS